MKKVFIITGANRGLGHGFVDVLIKDKNNFVISISRSLSEVQKTFTSDNFYFLKADLSESTNDKKLAVLKTLITYEAVFFINNASIIDPIDKIKNLEDQAIDRIISVNIKSPLQITKYLLRNFNENKLTFINIRKI